MTIQTISTGNGKPFTIFAKNEKAIESFLTKKRDSESSLLEKFANLQDLEND